MAVFAKTAANVSQRFASVSPPMPRSVKTIQLDLVLASHGGATNYIPATQLNFTKILSSSMAQKSDDSAAFPTAPSFDGSKLFFYNPANATDASRTAPADMTGTFRVTLIGN